MNNNPNIPPKWKLRKIVDFCQGTTNEMLDGDWILSEYIIPNGDVRLIQLGNIGIQKFIDNSYKWISKESFYKLNCKKLETEDILISRMADPIARSCILPEFEYDSITAVDVSILRVYDKKYDRKYVNYIFNSFLVKIQAENLAAGATRKRISRKNLQSIRVPVPPLVEQRGIVEVLGTVDECIHLTDAVIERVEELKRGLMQQLLTRGIGHTEYKETPLGEIPKTWIIDTLMHISDEIKSGFASGKRDDKGIIQLRMNNVTTDGRIVLSNHIKIPKPKNINKYLLKEKDVLFNNTNSVDLIGKTGIFRQMEEPVTYSNHFTKIRVNENIMLPEWVLYHFIQLWEKGYFKRICHRHVGQAGINQSDIKQIIIPIPPIDEQEKIILMIENVSFKKEASLKKLEYLFNLKQGLMQILLSGKTRVELKGDELHRIGDGREANN